MRDLPAGRALALQIAIGGSGRQADRGGALAELSDKPFGAVLLCALGFGLVGMALWRLSEALFGSVGSDGRKARKRLPAVGAVRLLHVRRLLRAVLRRGFGRRRIQVRAALDHEPDRAKGLYDTLRSFADTPLGPWLPACAAAGLLLWTVLVRDGPQRRV